MAAARQIMCVVRTDGSEAHHRISHVGGPNTDGTLWRMTRDEAVTAAEAGECRFYASVWDRPVWVVVATNAHGDRYLRTDTDGAQPNNLLTLPACPSA